MRLSLLATAAFVAVAAVRVPFSRHCARDLPEGVEAVKIKNSTYGDIELFPQSIPDGIGWYAKDQGPQDVKVMAPELDEPLDAFSLRLTMGNKKQHVGKLHGPDLYRAMHFALMELCPEGRGECFTREEKVWYMNVEFKDKSGFHEQQAEITVTGSSYDGPGSHDNRNLRRQLMIAAIAGAWERQSNDGKNCFTAPKDGWDETHCNIGHEVTINIADQDYITAEIKSAHHWGNFDCVATISSVREAVDKSSTEWRRAYHGADLHGIEVTCPDKGVTKRTIR